MCAATLSAVTAATKIGGSIDIVVGGAGCGAVADAAAKLKGVRKVFCADAAVFGKPVSEDMEKLVLQVHAANKYSHIMGTTSSLAKSTLPRVAAILDVNQISDVINIQSEDTFTRPIYAGNALASVKSSDAIKVLTVRPTAFDKAADTGGSGAVEAVSCEGAGLSTWKSEQIAKSDRPDLASAGTVVAGGRGLKSGDNFKLVYDLADKLGAAVGASRAAVDAGYIGNDLQVRARHVARTLSTHESTIYESAYYIYVYICICAAIAS
jgi:electron transfer flavoprotein alpha subunit